MKTSLQWWEDTLSSPEKILHWLTQQYEGEASASERIEAYILSKAPTPDKHTLVEVIMSQEERHSEWIKELLSSRTKINECAFGTTTNRYWSNVIFNIDLPMSYEQACAVASHAEGMRLERIKVIVQHPNTTEDIREVFKKILPEEQFHYKFFTQEAGSKALNETTKAHAIGLEALGLVI